MNLIFRAETISVAGKEIRVDIWADRARPLEDVYLGSGDAVVVEWDEADEASPTQGSRATITLESAYDRQFVDLYATDASEVICRIYVANKLYWCGALDPEFYEEPWHEADHYDVSLTFTDFGAMGRIPIKDTRRAISLASLLNAALTEANITNGVMPLPVKEYLTTKIEEGESLRTLTAADISVGTAVFRADDTPKTYREAIDAILTPLGWRITQRQGTLVLYEWDAIARLTPREVYWTADAQTYAAVPNYSRVTLKYSPGACDNLLPTPTLNLPSDSRMTSVTEADSAMSHETAAVTPLRAAYWAPGEPEFGKAKQQPNGNETLIVLTSGDVIGLTPSADHTSTTWPPICFKTKGDSEKTGVIGFFPTPDQKGRVGVGLFRQPGDSASWREVMILEGGWLPAPTERLRSHTHLRLKMEALIDARWVPADKADKTINNATPNAAYVDSFHSYNPTIYLPVLIGLYDDTGKLTHYYSNANNIMDAPEILPSRTLRTDPKQIWRGVWVPVSYQQDPRGAAWLCYRNTSGSEKFGGWRVNRHADQLPRKGAVWGNDTYKRITEGEIIPYPPCAGTVKVTVYEGAIALRRDIASDTWSSLFDYSFTENGVTVHLRREPAECWRIWCEYSKCVGDIIKWMLVGFPTLELWDNWEKWTPEESDLALAGYVDRRAQSAIELSSICGVMTNDPHPFALGILQGPGDTPLSRVVRNGVAGNPERLTIGSLYSQCVSPRISLSGEMQMPAELAVYEDANARGAVLHIASETAYLQRDVSNCKLMQIRPDTVKPYDINEVDE